jgi:hypothetical protein
LKEREKDQVRQRQLDKGDGEVQESLEAISEIACILRGDEAVSCCCAARAVLGDEV